ncbi:MAG TPA: AI-2E family transporter [Anaeromyxobacter sp.]
MTDAHARRLLVFLVVLAVVLTALVVRPFWQALFLAAVLAAALRDPMERLARLLGGRRKLSATAVLLALLAVVLLPVTWFGAVVVAEAAQGVAWLRDTLQSEGVSGLLQRLPDFVQRAVDALVERVPQLQEEVGRLAGQQGTQAAAAVGGVLAATGSLLLQTAMMLIAFFFFLVDGARLVAWLEAHVPLGPGQFRALMADFRQTSVSVLLATLGTAAIQSGLAVVGYFLARAPNPLFLGFVTFFLALVPAVGATIVVLTVAMLLAATGHLVAGLFLAAWGIAVVALVDNVARPFLLKGGMELHGALVFFALLGALAAFGPIGLVAGPLVLTFLVAVLRLYRREFG